MAGRPKKVIGRKSINSGRKRIPADTASRSTKYRRAHEIVTMCDSNPETITIAQNLLKSGPQYLLAMNILKHCDRDLKVLEIALKLIENGKENVEEHELMDEVEANGNNNENTEQCALIQRHSPESALSFYVNNDFSKAKWINLHKDCKARYPCYDVIQKEKKKTYPQNITITQSEAKIPLQSLLDKTSERYAEYLSSKQPEISFEQSTMVVNLGFDGSSGHVNPHQKSVSHGQARQATATLFITSMTVLKLTYKHLDENLVWVNHAPQSHRFCRPVRLSLELETKDNVKQEYDRLTNEISQLTPYTFQLKNGKYATVDFKCFTCMFDGKDVNIIVNNKDNARCPVCLKSVHHFGKNMEVEDLRDAYPHKTSSIELGIGVLHCLLRCFEHLLNIAYRMTIKQWDVRKSKRNNSGLTLKEMFEEQKRKVQDNIYHSLGVKVSMVMVGFGTSNTGNVARRCLDEPEIFAMACGLDSQLVEQISMILLCYRSKERLDFDKVQDLSQQAYRRHFEMYSWARMNPTLHKMLIHGPDIGRNFSLPLSFLAEDGQESWHKHYRRNLVMHARQDTPEHRLQDTLHTALQVTDPFTSIPFHYAKYVETTPPEIIQPYIISR